MYSFFFLFVEKIPIERFNWLKACISSIDKRINISNSLEVNFYLTGDALFSLYDLRYQDIWKKLLATNKVKIIIDFWDLKFLGLDQGKMSILSKNQIIFANSNPYGFWNKLINHISVKEWGKDYGFLQMRGPYMSRTTVHLLRALKSALENDLSPELYAYLDGVHIGHDCQRPSEFENIGNGLKKIQELAKKNGKNSQMLACSRCGTARGYIKEEMIDTYHQSDDNIPSFLLCNLNRIIDRFENNHIILSPSAAHVHISPKGITQELKKEVSQKKNPPLLILITHSPYGSEWTFGGLSFAMACASHNIPTDVIFIEDGSYVLMGEHIVHEQDGIFNIQEIIEATADMEFLQYYVYEQSLKNRGISRPVRLEGLKIISTEQLTELLISDHASSTQFQKRIIIF
ncbi:MAG: DsrE family protein [Promethearchaeia archaeon]